MGSILAFLPSILGGVASLFKGKKTQQAPQQTPQQLALTQFLTNLAKQNMQMGAANKQPTYDALNMISKMFGVGGGNYGMPQNTATPAPGSSEALRQRWQAQYGRR